MQSTAERITVQFSVEGIAMQSYAKRITMQVSVEGVTMSDQDQRTKGYYISGLILLWSFGVGPKVL